jgi:oligopeptide transport system substrate-binding protein
MTQAKSLQDLNTRAGVIAQAEQIMLEDMPIIPLTNQVTKNLVGPQVKGYVDNIVNWHRSRWMRIER